MRMPVLISAVFLSAMVVFFLPLFSQTFAQEKPQSVKIEEYIEKNGEKDLTLLAEKTESFAGRFLSEPKTTQAYIVFYTGILEAPCVNIQTPQAVLRAEFVKNLLLEKYNIPSDRITVTTSTYRNDTEVELWLVPKGADKPRGRGRDLLCECPQLEVTGDGSFSGKNKYLTFTANISGGGGQKISYDWTTSAGTIVEGQGTSVIKVALSNTSAKEVTATVKIDGCCLSECLTTASFTSKRSGKNQK